MTKDTEAHWIKVATGPEKERLSGIRRRLVKAFGNGPPSVGHRSSPFVQSSWKMVLVPRLLGQGFFEADRDEHGGWPLREPPLPVLEQFSDPLLWCLKNRKSETMVLTSDWPAVDVTWQSSNKILYCQSPLRLDELDYTVDLFYECGFRSLMMGVTSRSIIAFDESEDWAIADGFDEYHILGGTPEFIDQYYAAAGGEEYVRAWYYHQWLIHKKWFDEDHRSLVDLVGWPQPVWPANGGPYGEDDIDWTPMFGDRIKSCGPGIPFDPHEKE